MNSNDLKANAFFTKNGEDIWEMLYFCLEPTCRLKNLKTGQEEDFGMGGLTAQNFHRIQMPEAAISKAKEE